MSDTGEIERLGERVVFYVLDDLFYYLSETELNQVMSNNAVMLRTGNA